MFDIIQVYHRMRSRRAEPVFAGATRPSSPVFRPQSPKRPARSNHPYRLNCLSRLSRSYRLNRLNLLNRPYRSYCPYLLSYSYRSYCLSRPCCSCRLWRLCRSNVLLVRIPRPACPRSAHPAHHSVSRADFYQTLRIFARPCGFLVRTCGFLQGRADYLQCMRIKKRQLWSFSPRKIRDLHPCSPDCIFGAM